MDNFSYLVYIPSLNTKKRFIQLNNNKHISIVKFIQNKDVYLAEYLVSMIEDMCIDNINVKNLTGLDLLCILLAIRNICIGTRLELTTDVNNEKSSLTLDLGDILKRVTDIKTKSTTIKIDNIHVTIEIPRTLVIESYIDFISKIKINKSVYDMRSLSKSDKHKIADLLPGKVVTSMYSKIGDLSSPITIVKGISTLPEMVIDVTTSSIFEFIKLIFDSNLSNFYTYYYLLASKMHLDLSYIDNITPIETEIYINKYKEEMEIAQKSIESESKSPAVGNIPAPSPGSESSGSMVPGGFKF